MSSPPYTHSEYAEEEEAYYNRSKQSKMRPLIKDYIEAGQSADEYIADLRAAGNFVSGEAAARIGDAFARARATGPSYTPRQEKKPAEGFGLGWNPELPEPLIRHTNAPVYKQKVDELRTGIGNALQVLPGGSAVLSRYIEDIGAVEYSFEVAGKRVSTQVQPGRYGHPETIDWATSVATPTSVREKLGEEWIETNYLTAAQGIAQTLARATQAKTSEEAERILAAGRQGFGNVTKYPEVSQSQASGRRLGSATRIEWHGQYEPSNYELYRMGGLPEGSFMRGRPVRADEGVYTHTAYDIVRGAAPGFIERTPSGYRTGTTPGKAPKHGQLGTHETAYGSFRFAPALAQETYTKGRYSGEYGRVGTAFFAQTEIVGSGMGLMREGLLQGRVRYAQKPFKAQGQVEWVASGTKSEPGQPLVVGWDVVGEERRPITYTPPKGATATFATSGRFDPNDERSWRYEVEAELPGYSGQFKIASQGIKMLAGAGRESAFQAWAPIWSEERGRLQRRQDQPFDILASQEQVKVPRSTLIAVADAIAASNPRLAAALQLPAGQLAEEDLNRLARYANDELNLGPAGFKEPNRGMRLLWQQVHETELQNYMAGAGAQRAQKYKEQLGVDVEKVEGAPFYHVPILEEGTNLPILYQLQEQYPTRRNVLSLEQLGKIARADPLRYGPMVKNWQRFGGTAERQLALAYRRNYNVEITQDLDPIDLRASLVEAGKNPTATSTGKLGSWQQSLETLGYNKQRPFAVNLASFLGPQEGWQSTYDKAATVTGAKLPRMNYTLPMPNVIAALAQSRESGAETSRLVNLYMKSLEGLGSSDVSGLTDEEKTTRQTQILTNLTGFHGELETYLQGEQVSRKALGARVPNQAGGPAVTFSGLAPNTVALGQQAIEQMWRVDPADWWRREQAERLMASGRAGVLARREPSYDQANLILRGITEQEMGQHAKPGTIMPVNLGWNTAMPEAAQTVMGGDFDADLMYSILTGKPRWSQSGRWGFGRQQPLQAMSVEEVLKQGTNIMRGSNPYLMEQVKGKPPAEQLAQAPIWHSEYYKYFSGLRNPKAVGWSAAMQETTKEELSAAYLNEAWSKQAMGYGYFMIRQSPTAEILSERIPEGPFREEYRQALSAVQTATYQPGLDRNLKNTGLMSMFYGVNPKGNVINRFEANRGALPHWESTSGRGVGVDPSNVQMRLIRELTRGITAEGVGEIMPASAAALLTMDETRFRAVQGIFEKLRSKQIDALTATTAATRALGEQHYSSEMAGPLLALSVGASLRRAGQMETSGLNRVAHLGETMGQTMGKRRMPFNERLEKMAGIPSIGSIGDIVSQTLVPFGIKQRKTFDTGGDVTADDVRAWYTQNMRDVEDVRYGDREHVNVIVKAGERILTQEMVQELDAVVAGGQPSPNLLSWWKGKDAESGRVPSGQRWSSAAEFAQAWDIKPNILEDDKEAQDYLAKNREQVMVERAKIKATPGSAGYARMARNNAPSSSAGTSQPAGFRNRPQPHLVTDFSDENMQRLKNMGYGFAQREKGMIAYPPPNTRRQSTLGAEIRGFHANDLTRTPEQQVSLQHQLGSYWKPLEDLRAGLAGERTDPLSMIAMLRGSEKIASQLDDTTAEVLTGSPSGGPGLAGRMQERVAANMPYVGDPAAFMAAARRNPALAQRQAMYANLFGRWQKQVPTTGMQEEAVTELGAAGMTGAGTAVKHVANVLAGGLQPGMPGGPSIKDVVGSKFAIEAAGGKVPGELQAVILKDIEAFKEHTKVVEANKKVQTEMSDMAYVRRMSGLSTDDVRSIVGARRTIMAANADIRDPSVIAAAKRLGRSEFEGDIGANTRAKDILAMREMAGADEGRGSRRGGVRALGGNIFDELTLGGTAFRMRMTWGLLTGSQGRWQNEFFQGQAPTQEAALMLGSQPSAAGATGTWLTAQAQQAQARYNLGRGVSQVTTPLAQAIGGAQMGTGVGSAAAIGGYGLGAGLMAGYAANAILPMLGVGAAAAGPIGLGVGLGATSILAAGYMRSEGQKWYQYQPGTAGIGTDKSDYYSYTWREAERRQQLYAKEATPLEKLIGFPGASTKAAVNAQMAADSAQWQPGNLPYDITALENYTAANYKGLQQGQGSSLLAQVGQLGGISETDLLAGKSPAALKLAGTWATMVQAGASPADIVQSATRTSGMAGISYGPQMLEWQNQWNALPRQQQLINEQAMQTGQGLFALRGTGPTSRYLPNTSLQAGRPLQTTSDELGYIQGSDKLTGSTIKTSSMLVSAERISIQIGAKNYQDIVNQANQQYGAAAMTPEMASRTQQLMVGVGGIAQAFGHYAGQPGNAAFEQQFIPMAPERAQGMAAIGQQISGTVMRYGGSDQDSVFTADTYQRLGYTQEQIQNSLARTYGMTGGFISNTPLARSITASNQAMAKRLTGGEGNAPEVEAGYQSLFGNLKPYMTQEQWKEAIGPQGNFGMLLGQVTGGILTPNQASFVGGSGLGRGGYAQLGGLVAGTPAANTFEQALNPKVLGGIGAYGPQLSSFMAQYGGAPTPTQLNNFDTGFGQNLAYTAGAFNLGGQGQQGYAWRQFANSGQKMNAFGGTGWQYGGYEYGPMGFQQQGYAASFARNETYGRAQHANAIVSAEGSLSLHQDYMAMTTELRANTKAMTDENRSYAMQQAGFAMQRAGLSYRQGLENVALQEEESRTRARQQREEFAITGQRQAVQVGWQQQDFTYQANMAGLQYGWQQEDYSRNIRFATGRQRQDMIRQQQRAQVTYGMESAQRGRERERFGTQTEWQKEDLSRQKSNFEELQALQEKGFALQRRHLQENYSLAMAQIAAQMAHEQKMWGLEDEQRKLEYDYQDKQMKFEEEQAKRQVAMAKMAAANYEADIAQQKTLAAEAKKYYDEMTKAYQDGGSLRSAFAEFIAKVQEWLDGLSLPDSSNTKARIPMPQATAPAGTRVGEQGSGWESTGSGWTEYAEGGIVTRPTRALIGEAGPEAVIPLSRMGAVMNSTVNVTVYLGDEDITNLMTARVASHPKFGQAIDNLARRQRNAYLN